MTYDERHGWVERGTKGHRASAQVKDIDCEVAALDSFRLAARLAEGYYMPGAPQGRDRAVRLEEQERHHRALSDISMGYALEGIREGDPEGARYFAKKCLERKLAMLAPWIAVLYAGDRKRAEQALDHELGPYTPNPFTPWRARHAHH